MFQVSSPCQKSRGRRYAPLDRLRTAQPLQEGGASLCAQLSGRARNPLGDGHLQSSALSFVGGDHPDRHPPHFAPSDRRSPPRLPRDFRHGLAEYYGVTTTRIEGLLDLQPGSFPSPLRPEQPHGSRGTNTHSLSPNRNEYSFAPKRNSNRKRISLPASSARLDSRRHRTVFLVEFVVWIRSQSSNENPGIGFPC